MKLVSQRDWMRRTASREFHTTGSICDILCTPDHQNLRGLTPILADISLTHPFVGNAVNREQRGSYQGKDLCQ